MAIASEPTRETAKDAVAHALTVLEPRFPRVAAKPSAAESDVLAYLDFPVDHWRSISSTNPIERVNAELDRRAKVVGIFPNSASLVRLFTVVLQDQHDKGAGRPASLQPAVHGAAAAPRGSTAAHRPAHRRPRRPIHRRCESSREFTPLQGT
jgi:putative transposase